MLQTSTKIAGARFLYRTLRTLGIAPKSGRSIQVRRSGIRWNLDLGEGFDFAIYLGAFERSTVATLRRLARPGDIVLDIGANMGGHTLPLAKAVGESGHVYAFEATDFAFSKLKQNLTLNPDLQHRVTATQVLLVDEPGGEHKTQIYASWPLEKAPGAHPKHLGQLAGTSGALIDTLDNLVNRLGIQRIDLIKLDVDGHEYPVLKGARQLIMKHAPTIVLELSPYIHTEEGNNFEAFIGLLKEWGYSLSELNQSTPILLDAAYLNKVIPDGASMNAIATASHGTHSIGKL